MQKKTGNFENLTEKKKLTTKPLYFEATLVQSYRNGR